MIQKLKKIYFDINLRKLFSGLKDDVKHFTLSNIGRSVSLGAEIISVIFLPAASLAVFWNHGPWST